MMHAIYLFIYLFLLCSNGFVLKIWRAKTATRATDWLFFFSFTIFHSINVIMVTHIHYLIFNIIQSRQRGLPITKTSLHALRRLRYLTV